MEIRQENSISIAPVVYEIVKNAFVRNYDHLPETLDEVIDFMKAGSAYVAYEENKPIGYFVLQSLDSNKQELKSIAVHQKFQGKGVGKLLMDKVLELTKGQTVELFTHPNNTSALNMYLKYGFTVKGRVENYLGDGQPRLKLVRMATDSE